MKEVEIGNRAIRKQDKNQKTKKPQTVQIGALVAVMFLLCLQIMMLQLATMW